FATAALKKSQSRPIAADGIGLFTRSLDGPLLRVGCGDRWRLARPAGVFARAMALLLEMIDDREKFFQRHDAEGRGQHTAQIVTLAEHPFVVRDEVGASGLLGLAKMRGVGGVFTRLGAALKHGGHAPALFKLRGSQAGPQVENARQDGGLNARRRVW